MRTVHLLRLLAQRCLIFFLSLLFLASQTKRECRCCVVGRQKTDSLKGLKGSVVLSNESVCFWGGNGRECRGARGHVLLSDDVP